MAIINKKVTTQAQTQFHVGTDGNSVMVLNSSGQVGIGTTNPSSILHTNSSAASAQTGAVLSNYDTTAGTAQSISLDFGLARNSGSEKPSAGRILVGRSSDWTASDNDIDAYMSFSTYNNNALVEHMRIHSSGDVLIGKTANDNTTAGIKLDGAGYASFVIANDYPIIANRLTSDGDIAVFRKDGSPVASIGAYGGASYIGGNLNGSIYFNGNTDVRPFDKTSLANYDNQLNLGGTTSRWKDLYLSGGAYLGGTGAANYLDDYEEGTWTPQLTGVSGNSGSQSYSTQTGKYIKIGDLVVLSFQVTLSNKGTMVGYPVIQGIPFASGTTGGINRAMNLVWADLAISPYSIGYLPRGSGFTQFYLTKLTAAGNISLFSSGNGDFNNNSTIAGTIVYRVSV